MEKEKKQLKNKKIWKWIIINLSLTLFGASIIANITYIPKYLTIKNRSDNTLNIDISAYDYTNKTPIKLFLYKYHSTMTTLGNLMAQYQNTYTLENNGALGRSLKTITYYDEHGQEHKLEGSWTPGKAYWSIYYNKTLAPVGIDGLYLHMNDIIEFRYTIN
ncbi:MAG: hypothetical protein ACRC8P_00220 [Spiroplasma sp.]